MKKQDAVYAAGAVLVSLALAVFGPLNMKRAFAYAAGVPDAAQEGDAAAAQRIRDAVAAKLERARQNLDQDLARLQNDLNEAQVEVEAERCALRAQTLGRLEASRAKLLAQLDESKALLQGRQQALLAQASQMAQQVRAQLTAQQALWQTRHRQDLERYTAQVMARAEEAQARALSERVREPYIFLDEAEETGWLGVSISEVTPDDVKNFKLPAERGAMVTEVENDSPAAKAGLKAHDVITEFNAEKIEGTVELRRLIRETPPGRTVQITYWRDGRQATASLKLESHTNEMMRRLGPMVEPPDINLQLRIPEMLGGPFMNWGPTLGVSVEDLSGQLGTFFGVPDGEGVLVREVNPGSPAEKAGVKAGDVITRVNNDRVKTSEELQQKLREHRDQKTLSLTLYRQGKEMSLNVELEHPKPARDIWRSRRVLL